MADFLRDIEETPAVASDTLSRAVASVRGINETPVVASDVLDVDIVATSAIVVPLAAFYVDRVRAEPLTSRPAIFNRIPSPAVPPATIASTNRGPWSFDFGTTELPISPSILIAANSQLVAVLTGGVTDRLYRGAADQYGNGSSVYIAAGGLTGTAGKYLKVSGSSKGSDRYHYISQVANDTHATLSFTVAADETGIFLRSDTSDGIYTLEFHDHTFLTTDFSTAGTDPTVPPHTIRLGTAAEVATSITTRVGGVRSVVASSGEVLLVSLAGDLVAWSTNDCPITFQTGKIATNRYYVAYKDEAIRLVLADTGSAGFGYVRVWVRTNGTNTEVYDSRGPTLAPGWSFSSDLSRSPGSSIDDIWSIALDHTADFQSEELVWVTIEGHTADDASNSSVYKFLVEDYIAPAVQSVVPWSSKELRIRFSEEMETTAADSSSILYYRDISGRISFHHLYAVGNEDLEVIEAPVAAFVSSDVDCFIGSYDAKSPANNGVFQISRRLSATLVAVDKILTEEPPADLAAGETAPTLVLSNFKVTPIFPTGVVQPAFTPVVTKAIAADPLTLAPGDALASFVHLHLHDDLTPEISYQLDVANAVDAYGVAVDPTYSFVSWQLRDVPGRDFSLWDMIPDGNKAEDVTHELEALIRSFDEVAQVILADSDRFGDLLDPMSTKVEVLDVMLAHLGNPLPFVHSLTEQKKRDLIPLLVPMYKKRGTAAGIEDAVAFFIGKTVAVVPWTTPLNTWVLGVSLLGHNTYIGPSSSFVRYSFVIEHDEVLTAAEEEIIRQIVEFSRPAHTHFVGFRLLD